jgi:hypothetical protein
MPGQQDQATDRTFDLVVTSASSADGRRPIERALTTAHARARIEETIRAVVEDAMDPIGSDLTERSWMFGGSPYDRIIDDVAEAALEELTAGLASAPDRQLAGVAVGDSRPMHG